MIAAISIFLILLGEICFYTTNTIVIYTLLTGTGVILQALFFIRNKITNYVLKIDNFIFWCVLVYVMYFLYGFLLLQKGEFPWYTLLYRCVEVISLYQAFSIIMREHFEQFIKILIYVGLISLCYLVSQEGTNIIKGDMRIGDSLSGNVNTVGYNFGIISTLIMNSYCQNKSKYKLLIFAVFSLMMILTGSKKIMIIFLINMAMYFWYERYKIKGWVKLFFVSVFGLYLIFFVPYFYNILGFRIEVMIESLFSNNLHASYSTEVRELMMNEAFGFFLENPLFGGGWNYFYAHTVYGYEYSHCNYTEMLSSFGVFGTILYYSRHLKNIIVSWRFRNEMFNNNTLAILMLALTLEALLLDFAVVSFSAQCIWYLPMIICSVILKIQTDARNKGE